MTVFDAARWWSRIVQELNALRRLQGLFEDAGALEYYLDRFGAEDADAGFLALTDVEKEASRETLENGSAVPGEQWRNAEAKLMVRADLLDDLANACTTYRRQTSWSLSPMWR